MVERRMPFGKHAGWLIEDLPDDYLVWLYENADLKGWLNHAIDAEFDRRFPPRPEVKIILVQQLRLDARTRSVCSKLIEAGYRHLALKNHPDVGGTHAAMKAINQAIEILRKAVGEREE